MALSRRHSPPHSESEDRIGERRCAHLGCEQPADYPAPRSRDCLDDHIWFCLEHVRDYNRSWDYYAGMDSTDIERHIRNDITWNRPTWPLGTQPGRVHKGADPGIGDQFGVFGKDGTTGAGQRLRRPEEQRLPAAERAALRVMELSLPVTLQDIRTRYHALVKRLHPDANGGDKEAEERLKSVTQAYTTLKNSQHLR